MRLSSILLPVLGLLSVSALVACGEPEEEDDDDDTTAPGLGIDSDNDGFTTETDCDDNRPTINPDAEEQCNSVDDDCDGEIDEGVRTRFYGDLDEDGYGDPDDYADLCNQQPGQVTIDGDCNDDDDTINPDATEVCDEVDNNCDGTVDEDLEVTMYEDNDGDGFGRDSTSRTGCPDPAFVLYGGDCDDNDIFRYPPPGVEICGDGVINICNSSTAAAEAACTGDITGGAVTLDAGLLFTGGAGELTGFGAKMAGDINGDNVDDVLVGAPGASGGAGEVYVLHGGTTGGEISTQAAATLVGEVEGLAVGDRIHGGGDINKDGYDDILVAGPAADVLYMIAGPVTGTRSLLFSTFRAFNPDGGLFLGYSVDVGDVNGDGWRDVMLGAPLDATGATDAGSVYLLPGPFTATSDSDVADLADTILYSDTGGALAGFSASASGDHNGDGVDDIVVGLPAISAGDGTPSAGGVRIVYGPPSSGSVLLEDDTDVLLEGLGYQDFAGTSIDAADFDGDGIDDLSIASLDTTLSGRVSVVFGSGSLADGTIADTAGATFTPVGALIDSIESYFASSTGDLNSDGKADLIIGTPFLSYGGASSGSAFVVSGADLSGAIDATSAMLQVRGIDADGQVGRAVSGAGDFDDDGRPDVLVGAPGASAAAVLSFEGTGSY